MLNYIKDKLNKFELWVASWLPGLKVRITASLGIIGGAAAIVQEYITGLPLEQFITPTKLALANVVLFSLAYWFKRLSEKE